jgi:hypothetical protein
MASRRPDESIRPGFRRSPRLQRQGTRSPATLCVTNPRALEEAKELLRRTQEGKPE